MIEFPIATERRVFFNIWKCCTKYTYCLLIIMIDCNFTVIMLIKKTKTDESENDFPNLQIVSSQCFQYKICGIKIK